MPAARKILVVDDSKHQREFLLDVIRRNLSEWEVLTAASVEEAVLLVTADLTAAVLDLYLTDPPDEDMQEGLEILRAIESKAPDCFKILVTSRLDGRPRLDRGSPHFDEFVCLRYIDSSPAAELARALAEARSRSATSPE